MTARMASGFVPFVLQKSRAESQRHRGTEEERDSAWTFLSISCLCVFVSLWRIVFLRKTGGVMRFCDHGGAAFVYKSGNCRGICVKIVLDFLAGRVGFLVNGAQRLGGLPCARGPSRTHNPDGSRAGVISKAG